MVQRTTQMQDDKYITGATLCTDTWTDPGQRPIMNFMMVTPKGAVFQSSVDLSKGLATGDPEATVQKNVEVLAAEWEKAVLAAGKDNIVAFITDSAVNEKAATLLLDPDEMSR